MSESSTQLKSAIEVLARKAWAKVSFDRVRTNPAATPDEWREAYTEFRAASRQVKKMEDEERKSGNPNWV